MKRRKLFSALFLAVAIAVICLPVFAFADITSGECGENATWSFEDGVLTISGSGAMTDFETASDAPWYSLRGDITNVVITEGVTSVGSRAFYSCSKLESVSFPEGLETIGDYAIYNNSSLKSLEVPSTVTSIGKSAFRALSVLCEITFNGNAPTIGEYVFAGTASNLNMYYWEDKAGFDAESWTAYALLAKHYESNVEIVKATCTDEGSKTYYCTHCDTTITEKLSPLGHDYVDGVCTRCKDRTKIDFGSCGTGVTYVLYGDGLLQIKGSGNMKSNPWKKSTQHRLRQ